MIEDYPERFNMKFIKIKLTKPGLHAWKEAPREVFYLSYPHRHLFYITVIISVEEDRGIEFHMFQREVDSIIAGKQSSVRRHRNKDVSATTSKWIDDMTKGIILIDSCEDFADRILKKLIGKYPGRLISVEVSEDNENSGVATNAIMDYAILRNGVPMLPESIMISKVVNER